MKSSRFCVEFVFLLRLTQLNSLLSLSSSLQRLNPYSLHHVRISSPNQPLQQIANPIKHTVLSSTYITQDKNFGNDLVGQSPRGVMAPTHKPNLNLLDYLWPKDAPYLRVFLILAMGFMFLGKWFNVRVPFILQSAVDSLSKAKQLDQISTVTASVTSSFLLYGFSKAMSVVSAEIKTVLFAHVSFNGLRKFANQIFQHLHELDAEFHLKTPSGVISVAYVRAIRGFQTLLFQIVFSVIPAFLELFLVSQILYKRCGRLFSNITLGTFSLYLAFTVWITQWRIAIRQEMVDVDNARNGYFIDSILNHEVVKYFTNEQRESQKFDSFLRKLQKLNIDSTYAIALLNFGQAFMFCGGLTASLLAALSRVQAGTMSVGDLVAVNSMLLQLSIPFNFMGYTCK